MVFTRRQATTKTTTDDDTIPVVVKSDEDTVTSLEEEKNIKTENVVSNSTIKQKDDSFAFQGIHYSSYEEMVKAKRKRNAEYLKSTGLLDASIKIKDEIYESQHGGKTRKEVSMQRGLKAERKRKMLKTEVVTRRKSSRLAGVQADGIYVEDEKGRGRIVVGGATDGAVLGAVGGRVEVKEDKAQYYNNRINDGSDISLAQAVENTGSKWVKDNTLAAAEEFMSSFKKTCEVKSEKTPTNSPRSTAIAYKSKAKTLEDQVEQLSLDSEDCVAKVVPDRIFSINFHPTSHKLITAAADKSGYLGLWDVDCKSDSNDRNGVHLFKPYNNAISNMEWDKSGTKLLSSSYDGSMRLFDIHKESFVEIYATYDKSEDYKGKLGYGMDDEGWMQYSCLDHRNNDCMFYSTSAGNVVHIDTRENKFTFNANLSEKKINTLSLHPEGNILATCGLDYTVKTWDIRKIKKSKSSPLATQQVHRSINSAFFSPTGKYLLTTTMSNTLDIIVDAHLQNDKMIPEHRIKHNNQTGRWLATFHAKWHPTSTEDLFVAGSLQKPRTMQIFNGDGNLVRDIWGDSLTAVVSRCCFHPSMNNLIVAGGNSSGRVTIAR